VSLWWSLLRDIVVTGTGLAVIWSQVLSAHPDGILLGTGLALTVPSIADHVRALLPSSGGGSSSASSPSPGPRPGPSSSEAPGE